MVESLSGNLWDCAVIYMKIMVVDDDAGSLHGMTTALNLLGHNCDAYNNPVDALLDFSPVRYSIVIIDLQMQPVNGIQLMDVIHTLNPALPVILVSGNAGRKWAKAAEERGAVAVLEKPLDAAALSKVLDNMAEG